MYEILLIFYQGAGTSSALQGKKTSLILEAKSKDKVAGGKNTVVNSSIEGATGSQVRCFSILQWKSDNLISPGGTKKHQVK